MAIAASTPYWRYRNYMAGIGFGCLLGGGAGVYLLRDRLEPNLPVLITTTIAILGVGLLIAAVVMSMTKLMPSWYRDSVEEQCAAPAYSSYMRTLWKVMLVYVVLLIASSATHAMQLPQWLRAVIVVLPVLPLAGLMLAHLRYLRIIDELQRRVELESIGLATMTVSLVYMAAGFLQSAKVIDISAGLSMLFVFPLICMTYGITKIFVIRHYS